MPPEDLPGQEPTQALDAQPDDSSDAAEAKVFDEDYVKKLRREAAASRRALKELEAWKQEREQADLSDLDRARAENEAARAQLEALQKQIRGERLQNAVMSSASKAGVVDPEAAFRLLDLDAIEYDESGTPSNLDSVVKQLIKSRPYLKPQPSAGNPASPGRGREAQQKTSDQDLHRQVYGEPFDLFDADLSRNLGGGVIFHTSLSKE